MELCIGLVILFSINIGIVHCKIKIVDLSHLHNGESIMWPTYPAYNFTITQRGPYLTLPWLETNTLFQTEHMGTHIDAPSHFGKGSWRTQQIPIERLMGPGVIINIKDKAEQNPDYRIVMDDVTAYENKYGRIPDGSIIMMYSGWYQKYPNKTAVFNTQNISDTTSFHFPGFHEDTVEWLIYNRHIYAIGGDTPSFDYGQSLTFMTHILIGKENVIGIENAAYLDRIPESGSTIFIPVVKIDDGSGGPTRLLATYDDGTDTFSNRGKSLMRTTMAFMLCTLSLRFILSII